MVTFSAFLLWDRALEWWRAVQRRCPKGVSWAQFKEEFTDKFFQPVTEMRRLRSSLGWSSGHSGTDYERSFLISSDKSHLVGRTKFRRPRGLL